MEAFHVVQKSIADNCHRNFGRQYFQREFDIPPFHDQIVFRSNLVNSLGYVCENVLSPRCAVEDSKNHENRLASRETVATSPSVPG